MISLLARIFIKNRDDVHDPDVRSAYGTLCSIVGICFNVLLFAGKFFAGTVTGSVAITADAFNNLSDAGSSIITLIGFRFAGQEPDTEHPFGHGRIEYLAGLLVSLLIIIMGFELAKSSVAKIIHPESVDTSAVAFVILIVSIAVKAYMFFYNSSTAKRIDSAAMNATAMDSFSDSMATSVVLITMIIAKFTGLNLDAFGGIAVSLFILYTGFSAAKETISPLLGQPPTREFVQQVLDIVLSHKEIVGTHDLVVHDYGPGRVMISLHAEVPGNGNIFELHDVIDCAETELHDKLGCEAVIHMDPIAVDDEAVSAMKARVIKLVHEIDEKITIHDFRMVQGPTHTNLVFDMVVPPKFHLSGSEVKEQMEEKVRDLQDGNYYAVIKVDQMYV